MTILEAAARLRARDISSVELAQSAIARIQRLDPAYKAFLAITAEEALQRARQADAELASGTDLGPLHGIPVAVKDLFDMRGTITTAGGKVLPSAPAAADSAVVEKLRTAGALLLGKLNLHELAYGITSANPHYGAVRNPWNPDYSPGGSSGGSGAAVATRMVYAAIGSDTGGSIRIPAAFCGTVGLKPTYGRVSRFGARPLGYTLDHVGPLTRSVRDAALVLGATAGHDRRDPASSRRRVPDYLPEPDCSIRGVHIGFPENFFFERLDPDVESAVRGAIARAESLGATIVPVTVPDIDALNAVGRVILLAEAAAVYAPCLSRREDFGPDVLALFDQGSLVPAADYINAQRLRRRMRLAFDELWSDIDCFVCPATPNTPPRIGATSVRLGGRDEDVRLATTRLVRGINVLGYPSLALPCGLSSHGLPIGMQIVGPAFEEARILRIGAALEDSGLGIPPWAGE